MTVYHVTLLYTDGSRPFRCEFRGAGAEAEADDYAKKMWRRYGPSGKYTVQAVVGPIEEDEAD